MIVNENDFKTLIMCPKLFFFQKENPTEDELKTKILNQIHSKITLYFLKNKRIDKGIIYRMTLKAFLKEVECRKDILPAEKTNLLNSIILSLDSSIKLFNIEDYIPIFGPFLLNRKISNSIIKLKINGIYRSIKKKTLHIVVFSSYKSRHSILNDPTIQYKIQELRTLVPEHYTRRTRVYAHVFYEKGDSLQKEIISSEELSINNFEPLIKLAESNSYYPIVPCLRKCKYKKTCK